MKTMKSMKQMERTAEKICFVSGWASQNKFYGVSFGKNASCFFICFINFVFVQTIFRLKTKNMKIMKTYEEGEYKGIYLQCGIETPAGSQKHEANMKMYEEVTT